MPAKRSALLLLMLFSTMISFSFGVVGVLATFNHWGVLLFTASCVVVLAFAVHGFMSWGFTSKPEDQQ